MDEFDPDLGSQHPLCYCEIVITVENNELQLRQLEESERDKVPVFWETFLPVESSYYCVNVHVHVTWWNFYDNKEVTTEYSYLTVP